MNHCQCQYLSLPIECPIYVKQFNRNFIHFSPLSLTSFLTSATGGCWHSKLGINAAKDSLSPRQNAPFICQSALQNTVSHIGTGHAWAAKQVSLLLTDLLPTLAGCLRGATHRETSGANINETDLISPIICIDPPVPLSLTLSLSFSVTQTHFSHISRRMS